MAISARGEKVKRRMRTDSGVKMSEVSGRNTGGGIRTGHAGVAEWTVLLTIYMATDVFLSYPSRVAQEAAEAAWMVPLISGAIAALAYVAIHWMMKGHPTESLLDIVERALTPVGSIVVGLIGFAYFVLQTALVMREFTETVVATVLPETPAAVVTILFLMIVMYYAYKGLEGMTRVAILISAFLVIGFGLLLILPLTWFHSYLLTPILGKGLGAVALNGLTNTSMFAGVFILAVMRSSVRNQRHTLRIGLISTLASALIMSVVLLLFVGTFAVAVTGKVPFPMYQLARLIYVGRFVQRVESLYVFIWTAAAIMKMGLGLWIAAYLYARAFHMPTMRPLILPMGMMLFVLSFLPPDFTTVIQLSGELLERFGWAVTIALPVIALLVATIVASIRRRAHGEGEKDDPKDDHGFTERGGAGAQ
ncbi:MAG: endospore germination permease [Firmicutes bacterium]|nr:endospore germination permease [Bacillota bacterium]